MEKLYLKRIKELRQQENRTQINVSAILGFDQSYYSKLERGKHEISVMDLKKIADFYHVSVDYILERTDKREINE